MSAVGAKTFKLFALPRAYREMTHKHVTIDHVIEVSSGAKGLSIPTIGQLTRSIPHLGCGMSGNVATATVSLPTWLQLA